jgi:putative SOS response-associated peptidase YedK
VVQKGVAKRLGPPLVDLVRWLSTSRAGNTVRKRRGVPNVRCNCVSDHQLDFRFATRSHRALFSGIIHSTPAEQHIPATRETASNRATGGFLESLNRASR